MNGVRVELDLDKIAKTAGLWLDGLAEGMARRAGERAAESDFTVVWAGDGLDRAIVASDYDKAMLAEYGTIDTPARPWGRSAIVESRS